MSEHKQKFILAPEWSIRQSGKSLFVSGGADVVYEIELLDNKKSFFASIKSNQAFTKEVLSPSDLRTFEELVTAEIVIPLLKPSKKLKVAVAGDNNKLLVSEQKDIETADIVLVVRTISTYAELLEKIDYQSLTKPHLFADIAFHHTFSIGPLVFPGNTACIACLQGRISTRWGDMKPPTAPNAASQYHKVAAELIGTELVRISKSDTSLTNKTISWNFQDRTVKTSRLLKVPVCPICNQNRDSNRGNLVLPWDKDEGTSNTV